MKTTDTDDLSNFTLHDCILVVLAVVCALSIAIATLVMAGSF